MASILDSEITSTNEFYSQPDILSDILNTQILPDYEFVPASGTLQMQRSSASRFADNFRLSSVHPLPPEIVESGRNGKECSQCCLRCLVVVTRLRWILIAIALLGAISVIVGIIFGVLNITLGSSFLTLSLTFIGLGVLLVLVVGIGWRCSPPGHEPCHAVCHLDDQTSDDLVPLGGGGRSRLHLHGRNQWFGGMLYPEFQYTAPPPSYNLAMQISSSNGNRAVNIDTSGRHSGRQSSISNSLDDISLPRSPPPTYRSGIVPIRPALIETGSNISTNSRIQPPPYLNSSQQSVPASIINSNNALNVASSSTPAGPSSTPAVPSTTPAGPSSTSAGPVETSDSVGCNHGGNIVSNEPHYQVKQTSVNYRERLKYPDDLPETAPSVANMISRFESYKSEPKDAATRRKGRYIKSSYQPTAATHLCRAVIHEQDEISVNTNDVGKTNSDRMIKKADDKSKTDNSSDVDICNVTVRDFASQSEIEDLPAGQSQAIKILNVTNQSRGTQTLSGNETGFSDS